MTLENMRYLLIMNNKEILNRIDEVNMSLSLIIEANNNMLNELDTLIVTDEQVQNAITETIQLLKKEDVENDT
jgi:formiminotetrahydrofolate cyclodeaminase